MIAYDFPTYHRHLSRARQAGIRLKATADPQTFRATSARTGRLAYLVRAELTDDGTMGRATCSCPSAGACKHASAALSSLMLREEQRAKDAARFLSRYGHAKRRRAPATVSLAAD